LVVLASGKTRVVAKIIARLLSLEILINQDF
jgi:hypothetical protein